MADQVDIAVVGSGVVGLAAAAALHDAGGGAYGVLVVDGCPPVDRPSESIETLRVSALSPASIGVLERIGAWAGAAPMAQAFRDMRVWDATSEPFAPDAVHFDADELGVADLGSIVENDRIRHALLSALDRRGVEVRFGQRLERLSRSRRHVTLDVAGGTSVAARLVIGADGGQSFVRRELGIAAAVKRYGEDALVLHVDTEIDHAATAWQQFNPDGPLALLPLADGRCSVVRSAPTQTVAALRAMDDAELGAALTAASNSALGALRPAGGRASFPLAAAQAAAYAVDRAVLVGDAAHRVHPLAGQGANLGIADVVALADTLAACRARGDDPGDLPVLHAYARRRRREAAETIAALDTLHRLFEAETSAARRLRITGMRWFNASRTAKRVAARAAMGIAAVRA